MSRSASSVTDPRGLAVGVTPPDSSGPGRERPARVASPPPDPVGSDRDTADSERRLLERVRTGSRSAAGALLTRHAPWLRSWAHGRLPVWARAGLDTSDLVQDALHRTLARISSLRSAHTKALRVYLRRAVQNRIGDHLRRAMLRRNVAASSEPVPLSEAAPQLQQVLDNETWERYLEGLKHLTPRHRRLVVGRVECGYSFRQLALIERLPSPDAARMAFGRALVRLSNVMPDA